MSCQEGSEQTVLWIGTSGYSYPHWRGRFYPDNLPSSQWLNFYAQHFNTVELNVTFYRLPPAKTFASWYKNTPLEFRFGLKGNRFITHIKGLKQVEEPVTNFFDRAGKLEEKLSVILWQLPPALQADPILLSEFCAILHREQVLFV